MISRGGGDDANERARSYKDQETASIESFLLCETPTLQQILNTTQLIIEHSSLLQPFFSSLPIMAPTKDQIAALLQQNPLHQHVKKDDPGSLLHFGGLEDLFTDNIHISIPGLGIDIHGSEALSASSAHPDVPPLTDIINTDHPVEALPPHVIGGGSDDWAVAILGSKATTHSGK